MASNYTDGSLGSNCVGVASSINHLLQYQGSIMHTDFFVYISLNSIMQSMDCIIYNSQPKIFRQVCFGCNASFYQMLVFDSSKGQEMDSNLGSQH